MKRKRMAKLNSIPPPFKKKEISQKLRRICQENDVILLAILGAYVRGKPTPKSELDVLIKFDKFKEKSLLDLIRAEHEMTKIFKRKVDLVTEGSLSPYLKKDILKSMRVVYEKRG